MSGRGNRVLHAIWMLVEVARVACSREVLCHAWRSSPRRGGSGQRLQGCIVGKNSWINFPRVVERAVVGGCMRHHANLRVSLAEFDLIIEYDAKLCVAVTLL